MTQSYREVIEEYHLMELYKALKIWEDKPLSIALGIDIMQVRMLKSIVLDAVNIKIQKKGEQDGNIK